MTVFQAMILGLVQGLTEFLPVSSSAHLLLVPWFLGWQDPGLAFDVALHWGTLLGVLVYYRKDIGALLVGWVESFKGGREPGQILPWLLIIGTLPAALLGVLFQDHIEAYLRSPWIVALTLAGVGLYLWLADRHPTPAEKALTWKDALLVGLAQAAALVPGVSRSGATIATALFLGLSRPQAVRFSFLLSIPIICGAGVLKSDYLLQNWANPVILAGLAASAVSGFLAIHFLTRFVRTRTFTPFVIYRWALAGVIAWHLLRT